MKNLFLAMTRTVKQKHTTTKEVIIVQLFILYAVALQSHINDMCLSPFYLATEETSSVGHFGRGVL